MTELIQQDSTGLYKTIASLGMVLTAEEGSGGSKISCLLPFLPALPATITSLGMMF